MIQTGLPASYMADTPSLVNSLSGSKNFSLKIGSAPWKKVTYDVKKEDIFVMPQPTGAMYSVLIKNDGKYIPEAKNILTGMKLKCLLYARILIYLFYLHSFVFHICAFPEAMTFIFHLSTDSPDFQILKFKSYASAFVRKFFPFP